MGVPTCVELFLTFCFLAPCVFVRGLQQIGVDFALKVINWDPNTTVRLQLWDIAGTC